MKAHSLSWAIQYIEGSPFSKFVKDMVEISIAAYGNNGPLGDRAKFTLNSCVGRFGSVLCLVKYYKILIDFRLNIERQRQTTFAYEHNLFRHLNSALYEKDVPLLTEYPTSLYEVTKKKKKAEDKIPVQISEVFE